jgi:hypothetical protein
VLLVLVECSSAYVVAFVVLVFRTLDSVVCLFYSFHCCSTPILAAMLLKLVVVISLDVFRFSIE